MNYQEPFSDKEEDNNVVSSNASETINEVDERMSIDNKIIASDANLTADSANSTNEINVSFSCL